MALFNLIARLGLDNSQFRSGLRQSQAEASGVASRISSEFNKIGKGLLVGGLGFGGLQSLISQYKQLGNTIEEVQKKSAEAGREISPQAAEDVAFANRQMQVSWLNIKETLAPYFRSAASVFKVAMTPYAIAQSPRLMREYDRDLESVYERPEAMEAMRKKLEQSQESQRKQAEAFAAALAKEIEKRGQDPKKFGLQPTKETMMDKQVAEYLKRVAENTEALNVGL